MEEEIDIATPKEKGQPGNTPEDVFTSVTSIYSDVLDS